MTEAVPNAAPEQQKNPERVVHKTLETRHNSAPSLDRDIQEATALSALVEKLPPEHVAQEAVARVAIGARVKLPRVPKSLYGVLAAMAVWGNAGETTSAKAPTAAKQAQGIEQIQQAPTRTVEAPKGPTLTQAQHEALIEEVARAARESQKIIDRMRTIQERQRERELARMTKEAQAQDERMMLEYVAHHLQELAALHFSTEAIQALFDEVFQKNVPEALRQDTARASKIWKQLEEGMKKSLDENYSKDAAQGMYAADVLSPHEAFTRATEHKDPETLDMIMSELFAGQGKFGRGEVTFQIERLVGDMGQKAVDLGSFGKVFEALPEDRRENWALMLQESVVEPFFEQVQSSKDDEPEPVTNPVEDEERERRNAQNEGLSYERYQELQQESKTANEADEKQRMENMTKLRSIVAKYIPEKKSEDANGERD